jgi:hypothetical protein
MAKPNKVTFTAAIDFTGYPFGAKHEFKADKTSIPVAESFAEMMREKGLVKNGTHFTPVSDEPKDTK